MEPGELKPQGPKERKEERIMILVLRLRDHLTALHPVCHQEACTICENIEEATKVFKKWDQGRRWWPRE